jgi:hypothetical protein
VFASASNLFDIESARANIHFMADLLARHSDFAKFVDSVASDRHNSPANVSARVIGTQLYQQKNNRYHFASVSIDEEAGKLIEAGWTHVCNNPSSGRMLFRKPK